MVLGAFSSRGTMELQVVRGRQERSWINRYVTTIIALQ